MQFGLVDTVPLSEDNRIGSEKKSEEPLTQMAGRKRQTGFATGALQVFASPLS